MDILLRGVSSFVVGGAFRRLQKDLDLRAYEIEREEACRILENPPPTVESWFTHFTYQKQADRALDWVRCNLPSKYTYYKNRFQEYLNESHPENNVDPSPILAGNKEGDICPDNANPNCFGRLTKKVFFLSSKINRVVIGLVFNFCGADFKKIWVRSLVTTSILVVCFPIASLNALFIADIAVAIFEKKVIDAYKFGGLL